MKTPVPDSSGNTRRRTVLAFPCLLALVLTACASAAPAAQAPSPTSAPATLPRGGGQAPVILRVQDRQKVVDGYRQLHQDIYYMDPDGDADAVTCTVVSSSLAQPITCLDDPITISADEQKAEAVFTVYLGRCSQKMEVRIESRIRDAAGNLSEPVPFALSCTERATMDTAPLLIRGLGTALGIGLVLALGFWLLFRKRPAERLAALRSTVLISFLFMVVFFIQVVFHEGGHALVPLMRGVPITLYVHPFRFAAYARPIVDATIGKDILGSATSLPLCLLISGLLWKRRRPVLLPLVMLFPYAAMGDGINLTGVMGGDFSNVVQSTGLPAPLFLILGGPIVGAGLVSMFSLFPLAGMDPKDKRALYVLPASLFLIGIISFVVAHLFVLGSPIDREYWMGPEIILSANLSIYLLPIMGTVLAVLYVTLFRWLYPRLPAWLRNETVRLTWKDLRLPGILWAVVVAIGLIVVI
jgi:hypothetical protein